MKTILLGLTLFASFARAESWNGNNNPANMDTYNYRFDQMPLSGAVEPAHMPWSDNYWESDWGGISLRWSSLTVRQRDPDLLEYDSINRDALFQYAPPSLGRLKQMSRDELVKLSPAEKYDILMSRYDYPTVNAERTRVDPSIPNWQGLCHGWVPASINNPEPMPTDVMNADGILIPFGSSDLKGLMTYYYGVIAYDFARGEGGIAKNNNYLDVLNQPAFSSPLTAFNFAAGSLASRFLENAFFSQIERPRPKPTGYQNVVGQIGVHTSLNDPNPGAFHVVMANQLGLMHQAFAGNLNLTVHPNEIWNQPISSFTSKVDYDHRSPYGGNVGITTSLTFVTEIPQTWDAVVGTPNQRFKTMIFSYDLEVDSDGMITGGRWRAGIHPNFLWNHHHIPVLGYYSKLNDIFHSK